jgi:KDO2-lipid IV(A) lauroyltransferase
MTYLRSGVSACTLNSRLARLAHARVVTFVSQVPPTYRGYRLIVFGPFDEAPSGSEPGDARRLNAFLEEQISKWRAGIGMVAFLRRSNSCIAFH